MCEGTTAEARLLRVLREHKHYDEIIAALDEYNVNSSDSEAGWTQAIMEEFIDLAIERPIIDQLIVYEDKVRKLYLTVVSKWTGPYTENMIKVLQALMKVPAKQLHFFMTKNREFICAKPMYQAKEWKSAEGDRTFTVCDGLYHANSVSTAVSFIRHKALYSRQYGDSLTRSAQTEQWSDKIDKKYNIYNDCFFDNCDIRLLTDAPSVYGPVTFVVTDDLLKEPSMKVRITKSNPGMDQRDWMKIGYEERFFTTLAEINEQVFGDGKPFRLHFEYHTTFWQQEKISLDHVQFILVEKNQDEQISERIRLRLIQELKMAGFDNIPVYVRPNLAPNHHKSAAPEEVLWALPAW